MTTIGKSIDWDSISSNTLPQLREACKEKGIKFGSRSSKAVLVSLLQEYKNTIQSGPKEIPTQSSPIKESPVRAQAKPTVVKDKEIVIIKSQPDTPYKEEVRAMSPVVTPGSSFVSKQKVCALFTREGTPKMILKIFIISTILAIIGSILVGAS